MNMTREEAINRIEDHMAVHHIGEYPHIKLKEALDMAISTLLPVSREQVEKAWRGEWVDCSNGWMCSRCEYDNTYAKPFCPNCGAPMTDEAAQMVMERMEALHGETD